MVHETKESSLQKSPTDSSLAQLTEHETDDMEVMGSNPTGSNFDKIYFVLCNFRSVAATSAGIMKGIVDFLG